MAKKYKVISDQILNTTRDTNLLDYSQNVLVELAKVSVNSYIFLEYIDSNLNHADVLEDGTLDINDIEMSNVYKCVRSLIDSRIILLDSSISLETH